MEIIRISQMLPGYLQMHLRIIRTSIKKPLQANHSIKIHSVDNKVSKTLANNRGIILTNLELQANLSNLLMVRSIFIKKMLPVNQVIKTHSITSKTSRISLDKIKWDKLETGH